MWCLQSEGRLTNLQLRVGLTQAPVDAAVTVRLFKQLVQNVSHRLPLVHHQSLGAVVAHQNLYYELSGAADFGYLGCIDVWWQLNTSSYLPHFGFFQFLQSQFNFVWLCLGFFLKKFTWKYTIFIFQDIPPNLSTKSAANERPTILTCLSGCVVGLVRVVAGVNSRNVAGVWLSAKLAVPSWMEESCEGNPDLRSATRASRSWSSSSFRDSVRRWEVSKLKIRDAGLKMKWLIQSLNWQKMLVKRKTSIWAIALLMQEDTSKARPGLKRLSHSDVEHQNMRKVANMLQCHKLGEHFE